MVEQLARSIWEYKKASILTPVFVVFEVLLEIVIPRGINSIRKTRTVYVGSIKTATSFSHLVAEIFLFFLIVYLTGSSSI